VTDDAAFPTLTVSGGPFDGQSLVLPAGEPRTIGSAEDSSLQIDLENIDISHAQVIWDSRGLLLTDLDSSTGTYVNGEKIGSDHPLQDGDRVFLGPPGSKQTAKLAVRIPAEAPVPVDVVEQAAPVPAPSAAPDRSVPFASPPAPHKPEYTSDMPAIVSDRAREAPAVPERPPAAPSRPLKRPPSATKMSLPVPRPVLLGGAAAVFGLLGYLGVRVFQTPPPVLTSIAPPQSRSRGHRFARWNGFR
jgi:pSer/pThr/pTyr-binding forkhead associated (FHA) protein